MTISTSLAVSAGMAHDRRIPSCRTNRGRDQVRHWGTRPLPVSFVDAFAPPASRRCGQGPSPPSRSSMAFLCAVNNLATEAPGKSDPDTSAFCPSRQAPTRAGDVRPWSAADRRPRVQASSGRARRLDGPLLSSMPQGQRHRCHRTAGPSRTRPVLQGRIRCRPSSPVRL